MVTGSEPPTAGRDVTPPTDPTEVLGYSRRGEYDSGCRLAGAPGTMVHTSVWTISPMIDTKCAYTCAFAQALPPTVR